MRRRKNQHWLPCALAAACTIMFLTVLPRADSVPTGAAHDTAETSAVQSSVPGSVSNAAPSGETQSSVGSGSDSSVASSNGQQSSAVSSSASSGRAQSSAASSSNSSSAPSSGSASGSASSAVRKTAYRYDDADVTVTAAPAKPSAMPDGAKLCVVPITENKDPARYLAIKNSVTDRLKDAHRSMTGLLAYDIYFSADGKKIEPGSTLVTIHFKQGVFGGDAGKNTEKIRVLHLKKTGNEMQAKDVTTESLLDAAAVKNVSKTKMIKFRADSLSTFAVAGVKAMPKATVSLSEEDIRKILVPVLPYAVFADSFTLKGDMEGCIAVNNAAIDVRLWQFGKKF